MSWLPLAVQVVGTIIIVVFIGRSIWLWMRTASPTPASTAPHRRQYITALVVAGTLGILGLWLPSLMHMAIQ